MSNRETSDKQCQRWAREYSSLRYEIRPMRKFHLAPEEYRLRDIDKETEAFICPVITYGDLTSLKVLNVFIN